MTRWSHEDVRDLHLRAECAEDALADLVDEVMSPSAPGRTVVGIRSNSPLHKAIVLLTKQGTLKNKERAEKHLAKPLYPPKD